MGARYTAKTPVEPYPLMQALDEEHRDEREQLRATHRGALQALEARHDSAWEAQRELLRATRPHLHNEHEHQRQIEREEDVEADLSLRLRAEELTLQRSHALEVRALSQRQQQERRQHAAHLPAHHAASQRQQSHSQSPLWESLLNTLATKCDKLARLSLSAGPLGCRAMLLASFSFLQSLGRFPPIFPVPSKPSSLGQLMAGGEDGWWAFLPASLWALLVRGAWGSSPGLNMCW